jgi:UDP-N-acetylmuramoyl-L-alanyl-D-glutamate--2,6-diaminopimelate ligase
LLETARPLSAGRLITVFGCGGDRDRTKRAPMGQAAALGADLAIVTNDNPRGEAPLQIAQPIVEALLDAGAAEVPFVSLATAPRGYAVELDRAHAIELAILAAAPGDIVVVCGKGHESYQLFGTTSVPFDDRVEARRALALRRERRSSRRQGAS